jgi:hypothetical protein
VQPDLPAFATALLEYVQDVMTPDVPSQKKSSLDVVGGYTHGTQAPSRMRWPAVHVGFETQAVAAKLRLRRRGEVGRRGGKRGAGKEEARGSERFRLHSKRRTTQSPPQRTRLLRQQRTKNSE